jgi:hypothetical protein
MSFSLVEIGGQADIALIGVGNALGYGGLLLLQRTTFANA